MCLCIFAHRFVFAYFHKIRKFLFCIFMCCPPLYCELSAESFNDFVCVVCASFCVRVRVCVCVCVY